MAGIASITAMQVMNTVVNVLFMVPPFGVVGKMMFYLIMKKNKKHQLVQTPSVSW